MTGAAYIRVSTDEQLEFSPDSQLKNIRAYAAQHDIHIPDTHIYMDEGISGRSARKRPAFLRMIAAARQHPAPFQVILVWKFSRFARNRQDSILYKSMLRRDCGVDVVSVSEPLADDPTSVLVEALLEAMDEYYSLNLAGEVRRGMIEKFSRGQSVSVPPFGYRMEDSKFVPEESTAPFVPLIFRKYFQGDSLRQIALWLNGSGIRTSRGNPFESRTVEYLLSNPVYTGKLRRRIPSGEKLRRQGDRFYQEADVCIVQGEHLPLVTQELFDAVQELLTLRRKYFQHTAGSSPAHSVPEVHGMFRGLIRCSACGSLLTSASGGRAMQCGAYSKGRCIVSHYLSLKYLKPAVFCALEECPLLLEGHFPGSWTPSPVSALPSGVSAPLSGTSAPSVAAPALPSAASAPPSAASAPPSAASAPPSGTFAPSVAAPAPPSAASAPPSGAIPPLPSAPPSLRSQIRAEERRLERRLERLRLAYETGADSLEEYRRRKQEILRKLAALQEAKKEGPEASVPSCPSFSWNAQGLVRLLSSGLLTGAESNELLRLIFSSVIFSRAENRLQFLL